MQPTLPRQCPQCPGQLQEKLVDGLPYYQCFVCDWKIAVAKAKDNERPWGRFHIPLLQWLWNPTGAVWQMAGHPQPLITLFIFTAVVSVLAKDVPLDWIRPLERFHIPIFLSLRVTAALVVFLYMSFSAILTHLIAIGISQRSRSAIRFWTMYFFFASLFALPLFFAPTLQIRLALVAWETFLFIWAVRTYYAVDFTQSVGIWLVSWLGKGALVLIVVILASHGKPQTFHRSHRRHEPRSEPRGRRSMYEWNLDTLDGRRMSFAKAQGKNVFVYFWATSCGSCQEELPQLQTLFNTYRGSLRFYFISDEDLPHLLSYVKAHGYRIPVYRPADARPALFDVDTLPTTYILSPNGKILWQKEGATNWSSPEFAEKLSSLAHIPLPKSAGARKTPETPVSRPAGPTSSGEINSDDDGIVVTEPPAEPSKYRVFPSNNTRRKQVP